MNYAQALGETLKIMKKPEPDTTADEKGSGGLWDLAADIALAVAAERNAKMPYYAEDWGQERIYNILMEGFKPDTTAEKLLWLVEKLYFDSRGQSIYVSKNGKTFNVYYANHEEYLQAINAAYEWARKEKEE